MVREDHSQDLRDHLVILNCNEKVRKIVEELRNGSGYDPMDVVLIIQDRLLWEKNPQWHPDVSGPGGRFMTIVGCPTDEHILKKARISEAGAAVILSDPGHGSLADAPSTLTAIAVEKQNPQVHTVMELILSVNRPHLRATEVNEVVCLGDICEKLIAQSCITPGVKNLFENLLTTEKGTPRIFVEKIPEKLVGKSFRELSRKAVLGEAPYILIGFVQRSVAKIEAGEKICRKNNDLRVSRYVINPRKGDSPGKDTPLSREDMIAVIAHDPPNLKLYLN